jgi:hypothetical protein
MYIAIQNENSFNVAVAFNNPTMDKLKLKGLNLSRVFNYSCGRALL